MSDDGPGPQGAVIDAACLAEAFHKFVDGLLAGYGPDSKMIHLYQSGFVTLSTRPTTTSRWSAASPS